MLQTVQGSLFDALVDNETPLDQPQSERIGERLNDLETPIAEPRVRSLANISRIHLDDSAWIDLYPGWITESDQLFDRLMTVVPWHGERRQMYERVVQVPRLLSFYGEGEPLPDRTLDRAKAVLDRHYAQELGEPFATAGLCLYRDGQDSVAWHGDTIGRSRTEDTMVAIVSFGSPRNLLLRPKGGGPSRRYGLANGDLIVMGGSCQRTWDHAIPKTARGVGPRISVQFRTRGVR